ncbi:Putative sugar isomerase involved in processing of exogenous sialic acid [Edwardsiella anguillarum ET080813]|uniref:Putative sugar isomerase involved in processing of exogenous sialic acid n=1 Tax=Edwardsiella anguillarum ET080813 TaxID=667120 RepID=A0A076LMR8_9GAMM|nr:Putative sugar isomerase involved in processing of exogenous sialic acid [Edwardsiella anguillarum ET080813]
MGPDCIHGYTRRCAVPWRRCQTAADKAPGRYALDGDDIFMNVM